MKKGTAATNTKGKKGKEETIADLPPPPPVPSLEEATKPVEAVVVERKPVDRSFLNAQLDQQQISRPDRILKKIYSLPGLKGPIKDDSNKTRDGESKSASTVASSSSQQSNNTNPTPIPTAMSEAITIPELEPTRAETATVSQTQNVGEKKARLAASARALFVPADASLTVNKPIRREEQEFAEFHKSLNENMDKELEAALRLRDRRITRRRNRALGVPPDPNDSDDSLLAEINEATDEKLFPGYNSKPVIQSMDPVRLNVQQLKKKVIGTNKKLSTAAMDLAGSNKADEKEARFLLHHPNEILDSFAPDTRREFESLVLQKYYKNGAITGFKGKQEMQSLKLKSLAKHEIEDIQIDAQRTEKNLMELKIHLDECRANVTKQTAVCISLIKQINNMVATEHPLQIDRHLANPKQEQISSKTKDPLEFTLPVAPHLLQNRKFRTLSNSYLQSAKIAKESLNLIPYLEAEIVPVEHHLTILELQLSRLDTLRQDILESDIIDTLEMHVVEKYKKVEEKHRMERIRAAKQVIEEASCAAARERKKSMQGVFLKDLPDGGQSKRAPPGLPDIHGKAPTNQEQLHEREQESRKRNLQILQARVAKIRKALAEYALPAHHQETDEKELVLGDGEVDLSESPAVRETRRGIVARRAEQERLHLEQQEEQIKSKMLILNKVMDIEDLERKEHAQEKSKRELYKALEGLAPGPFAAFPVEKNPIQMNILKSRLKERISPNVDEMNKEVSLPPKVIASISVGSKEEPKNRKRPPLPPPKHKPEPTSIETTQTKITSPFMPDHNTVIFKDYEPEIIYSKTIKITNTSCRVNTFKLLPISVELATFFEVKAPPPGRMSAGMVCEVEFIFKPPPGYNQDIVDGKVEFLAEYGGVFAVKLGCSSKKCKPCIASVGGPGLAIVRLDSVDFISSASEEKLCSLVNKEEVDVYFGSCVQGGTVARTIVIRNDGAVSTEVEAIQCLDQTPCAPFFLSKGSSKFIIPGYSSLDLGLLFQPQRQTGNSQHDNQTCGSYILKFSIIGVPPITINCYGEILHSPLRISNNYLDFGISVVESIYRESVVVKNHSNVAIKYWIEIEGMTLRSQVNTATKTSRGTTNSDKNVDWGSDVCTDGIDSETGEPSSALTKLNFFSEDDIIEEDEATELPSEKHGLGPPNLRTKAPSNNLLIPGAGYGSISNNSGGRAASFILHDDQQQFTIRPIKRSTKNPAAMSKRSDNLEVEVQNMGELEISPKLAIIQPFETSTIWFKIKPSRSGHILLKKGENPYFINVKVKYMNQGVETPILLSLTGRVTTSDITFSISGKSGKEISFNECSLNEAKEVPIKISNNSRLPQKVRFNSSDPSVTVVFKQNQDVHGAVPIDPLSYEIRMVRFEPIDPGSIKARLSCHSIWNRNFELKCTGIGVKNLLRFENSQLRFGAVGIGSSKTCPVRLLSYGSKTTSFGSTLNLSKVSSVVKQAWSSSKNPKTQSENTPVETTLDQDTVTFEFGNPKIIGIYKRSKLNDLYEMTSEASDARAREICENADEAVMRTDPTLIKSFRPVPNTTANTFEFHPKNIDPQSLFSAGSSVVDNPRILVPHDVEALVDPDSHKLASITFDDPPPVLLSPKKGVLGPGDKLDVQVKLSIPSAANLNVYKNIQSRMRDKEELVVESDIPMPVNVIAEIVEGRRQSTVPDKKDEKGKKGKDTDTEKTKGPSSVSIAEISAPQYPPEPIIYPIYENHIDSSALESRSTKPLISKIYEHLDDTCVSILVPCKIHRTIPARIARHQQEIQQLEDTLKLVGSRAKKSKGTTDIIYLRIVAPIVSPDILLLEPESGLLDFGTLPLHKKQLQQFTIYNESNIPVDLSNYSVFDKGSPFSLVSNLKNVKLPPFSKFAITLMFNPAEDLSFTSTFNIFSSTSQVQVKLIGQGVVPTIHVDHGNSDIFMGDVVLGDTSTKSFKVFNTSYNTLTCQIDLANPKNERINPFTILPWSAKIEPNMFQEFTSLVAEFNYAQKMLYGEFLRPPQFSQRDEEEEDLDVDIAPSATNSMFSVAGGPPGGQAPIKQTSSSVGTGSTSKLVVKKGSAAPPPSKGGKQDTTEEVPPDLLNYLTSHTQTKFITITCPWKKTESGQFFVEPKELTIASIKSASFAKPETKRPPSTDYLIETWNGLFEYSEDTKGITVMSTQLRKDSVLHFSIDISSSKGCVEFGMSKEIPIKLVDPANEFSKTVTNLKKLVLSEKKSEKADDESSTLLFDFPIHIESYFKVTLKGGIRYGDPMGLLSQSENTIWFVKVVSQEELYFQLCKK
ncbi:UNVERIFIED_CONTAM: hypothetical protein HDU68_001232 [Siphonaria sp. JEL0065]|nr:hypothetical protein HDU68_001232 [Siphonaria sp. JEL0065]